MAAVKGDSRERLLDAAEELFAGKGFDATTTREIAGLSGDTLGTLSYHFRSKDDLLYAVVDRRFHDLAEERRAIYRSFQAADPGRAPAIEAVVSSAVMPFVEHAVRGEAVWRRYTVLLGRMMYVGHPGHYRAISDLTDPVAREVLGWIRAAAPAAAEVDLGYAYQFMVGCMIDCASGVEHGRIARVTDGAVAVADFEELGPRLHRFLCTGMRGLLGLPAAAG